MLCASSTHPNQGSQGEDGVTWPPPPVGPSHTPEGARALHPQTSQREPRLRDPPLHGSLIHTTVPGHRFIRHSSRDTGHFQAAPLGCIHSWRKKGGKGRMARQGSETRTLSLQHTLLNYTLS